jgi:hypothetical protein
MQFEATDLCLFFTFYDDSEAAKLCDIVIEYAERNPNDAEAGDLAARCRAALQQMYPV